MNVATWSAGAAGILVHGVPAFAQCMSQWQPPPPKGQLNSSVRSFGSFAGELVAGGSFTQASGRPASRVARWNGVTWTALGTGVNGPVFALEEFGAGLVVGGDFWSAGGQPVGHIAIWNGTDWSPMGGGLVGAVYDLVIHLDSLIAGVGGTTHPTGGFSGPIARWDGSGSWSSIGGGVGFSVSALAVHEGALIAAGGTSVGGHGEARAARWDGVAWQNLAAPTNTFGNWATSLAVHDGQLLAGFFNMQTVVYHWTSPGWQPLGQTPEWITLTGFAEFQGQLFAGAEVLEPGETTLGRWTGTRWERVADGPTYSVHALRVHDDLLHVGGAFSSVGGMPSPWWARWGCSCYADCTNSGSLTVADFGCFQTQFVAGDPYADCNGDGVLTVSDFGCFQTRFVQGCP